MKCPICGKDVELQKKQIGTSESGDPIFNEYAICRDCKKQWNLDKQRAKKMAAKRAAAKKDDAAGATTVKAAGTAGAAAAKTAGTVSADKKAPAEKSAPTEKKAVAKDRPRTKAAASAAADEAPKRAPKKKRPSEASSAPTEGSAKRRPQNSETAPAKKPVKKRPSQKPASSDEEQRYANIPTEKVRAKREKAVRKGYEEMLATDPNRKPVKKKKTQVDEDTKMAAKPGAKAKSTSEDTESMKSVSDRADRRKRPVRKHDAEVETSRKKYQPEIEEDEYEYDDTPRFRVMRIILGVLSLLGFAFFIYRGFVIGLSSVSSGSNSTSGTTFIVLALCMLVSAMLYLIMQKKNTIFAFLLPMIFYLGSAVFAFLQRDGQMELLISAIVSGVLAVISLILAILSRGGDDYEDDEDYDDPFEDDHDN